MNGINKWQTIKNSINIPGSKYGYLDFTRYYIVVVQRGTIQEKAVIAKTTPKNADQIDFETNYLSGAVDILIPEFQVSDGVGRASITNDSLNVNITNEPNNIIKGATDGTLIGNILDSLKTNVTNVISATLQGVGLVGDRLKVDAQISAVGQPSDNPGCPVFSNKSRVEISDTEISLPDNISTHATIYSYTGSGKLVTFEIKFDAKEIELVLDIDGNEIFNIDLEKIVNNQEENEHDNSNLWLKSTEDNAFSFNPHCPIAYNSSITIKARANSSSTSRKFKYYQINLTKET